MGSGYVLDFSNRTFEDFIVESTHADIYTEKYDYGSGSKANRLRGFWKEESNYIVGRLLRDLIDYKDSMPEYESDSGESEPENLRRDCLAISERLLADAGTGDIQSIKPIPNDKDSAALADHIRTMILNGQPEVVLDHIHTYLMKYFRCSRSMWRI